MSAWRIFRLLFRNFRWHKKVPLLHRMAYQEAQNLQCSRILKTNTTLPEVTISISKVAINGLKVPLFNVIFFSISGGANNPFLQEDTTQQYSYTADGKRIEGNQDQYYGAGYSQAQSGYSSSGFGELRLDRFSPILWILRSTLIFFRSSIRQVRHSKA